MAEAKKPAAKKPAAKTTAAKSTAAKKPAAKTTAAKTTAAKTTAAKAAPAKADGGEDHGCQGSCGEGCGVKDHHSQERARQGDGGQEAGRCRWPEGQHAQDAPPASCRRRSHRKDPRGSR